MIGEHDYEAMADELLGTTESIEDYTRRKGISEETAIVERALCKVGVERCCGCGVWWDYFELDGDGRCPDCYERERDGQAD